MFLIVGLGNPGPRYAGNRHNIGFMAVDEIVRRHDFGPWRRRFKSQTAEGRIGGTRVLALKPETFMNESGRAAGEALRFFKLDAESLLVFHDELDLKPGKVRVKRGGGAAGHNGLRSLDAHIGSDYRRVRMGIGHPGHKDRVQPYVLRDFSKAETPLAEKMVDAVAGEIPRLLADDDEGFMSRVAFLVTPPRPKPPPKPPAPTAAATAAPGPTAGAPADDPKETAAADGE